MEKREFGQVLNEVRVKNPLVQCLTNFVTMNDCANILLAAGASPAMAHHPEEAGEFAGFSSAVVLNMGTADNTEGMLAAGKGANQAGVPVVFDPVACGATTLRRSIAAQVLKEVKLAVIRGNASEIFALAQSTNGGKGVDASAEDLVRKDKLEPALSAAKALSKETGAVVVISGPVDLIVENEKAAIISNGSETMPRITGCGCMLTALIGGFCGATSDYFVASVAGTAAMGIAGDIAQEKMDHNGTGTGTFRVDLIDAISQLTGEDVNERADYETIS